MPVVRSHFTNLSLIVNRPLGAAIIWPVEPHHTLVITGPEGAIAVAQGQHLSFRVNGQDRRLVEPTEPPDRDLVPHLDAVAGVEVTLRGAPLNPDVEVPANIRAVCHLSGGVLKAKAATSHNGLFANADWTFVRPDGSTLTQRVTNYVVHELTVPDGTELRLADAQFTVARDMDIYFEQVEGCPAPLPGPNDVYTLEELEHLYALVNLAPIVPRSRAAWAGPILHQLGLSSLGAASPAAPLLGCDPVCGHLQMDHRP